MGQKQTKTAQARHETKFNQLDYVGRPFLSVGKELETRGYRLTYLPIKPDEHIPDASVQRQSGVVTVIYNAQTRMVTAVL